MVINRFILILLIVTSFLLCACGDDDIIIVLPAQPQLPKIDCEKYVNQIAADVAARGLGWSGAGAQVIAEARADCIAENRKRGY